MPKSSLRVLEVIELLAAERKPLGHAEIAQRLRIPKSSLTGLLSDLLRRRYVILDADTRRYALGAQVLTLSKGYLEPLTLTRVGRPVLTEVIRRINENSALSIRDNDENLVIAQESCSHPLTQTMVSGSRSPLHCTAAGKALVAFLDSPQREQLVDRITLSQIVRRTITDRDVFRDDLRGVALRGYAISDEEAIDGIYALAFPIRSNSGVVAALSSAIPVSRLTESLKEEVIASLRAGAAKIGAALGGEPKTLPTTAQPPSISNETLETVK